MTVFFFLSGMALMAASILLFACLALGARADRRTRQTALMDLYELQKSLVTARAAAVAGIAHFEAVNRNTRDANKESVGELSRLQAEINAELNMTGNLSRAIEGYSGVPTADQRRQTSWVFEDAARTVDDLNRALQRGGATPARLMSVPPRRQ